MEPSKRSGIYGRLVESKNDFLGILAYSVYKRQKNEIIEKYKEQGDSVVQTQLDLFHVLCASDTQLNHFRAEALKLAEDFAQASLEAKLDHYEKEYEQRLQDKLRELKPRFWTARIPLVRLLALAILALVLCSCADSYEILGLHLKRAADGDKDNAGHGYISGEGDPGGT